VNGKGSWCGVSSSS